MMLNWDSTVICKLIVCNQEVWCHCISLTDCDSGHTKKNSTYMMAIRFSLSLLEYTQIDKRRRELDLNCFGRIWFYIFYCKIWVQTISDFTKGFLEVLAETLAAEGFNGWGGLYGLAYKSWWCKEFALKNSKNGESCLYFLFIP